MAKKSKLLTALDAHKGRDYRLDKQKKLQKQAIKKKKSNTELQKQGEYDEPTPASGSIAQLGLESEGWESDESENAIDVTVNVSGVDDSDSDSESESGSNHEDSRSERQFTTPTSKAIETEEEDEIPLSDIEDLSGSEISDVIPYQRLTINNTKALLKAQRSITLSLQELPFSEHQTVVSSENIEIPDINDDLNRELAFYKQSLDAVKEARVLLKKEGVPFSRPTDYFAEMIKSDEHMGKIKQKMTDEAANKKAAAEARRQRDLKKFGKQVQVAKLQERNKAKRETLDKINVLKRKRRDTTDTANALEEDLFEVELENATKPDRSAKTTKNGSDKHTQNKRRKKDHKFGFGGKKRFAKSGDAASSADLRGFSSKNMKDQRTSTPRLGKSRRAKRS